MAATRGGDQLATSRGWLGQVADTDTGLIYLNARYYDPVLARFVSPDPLMNPGDPKTLDPYRYADNNPVMMTDPSGLYSNVCGGLTGSAKHACDASASHYKPIGSKSGFTPGSPGGGGSSAMPPRSGPRTSSRPPTVNGDDSYRPTMDGRIMDGHGGFNCVAGAYQCVQANLDAQEPSGCLGCTAHDVSTATSWLITIGLDGAEWWFTERPGWITTGTRLSPFIGGGIAALDAAWTGWTDPLYADRSTAVRVILVAGRAIVVGTATGVGSFAGLAGGTALGGALAFTPAAPIAPGAAILFGIVGDLAVSSAMNAGATKAYDTTVLVMISMPDFLREEAAEARWFSDPPLFGCRDQRQVGRPVCVGG